MTGPKKGELTLKADGSFKYFPKAGFKGTESFVVRAFDGKGYSDPITITIIAN